MLYGKKIVCIIPARLASTRFPKKIIALLAGKPMIQHVWEAACKVPFFDDVIIALDSHVTVQAVASFGGNFVMTPESCSSGTQRLVTALTLQKIHADVVVNWQADEPLVSAAMLATLLQSCAAQGSGIWTLKKKITDMSQVISPHYAKVVCDVYDRALYFSRSPIPYYRDEEVISQTYFKHVGMYAYTMQALEKISRLPSSALEDAEYLEQLRWLEHGLSITVHETNQDVIGVDLPGDIERVERMLAASCAYSDQIII